MHDAERLLTDLQSPYWWTTAVALAIAVNILSSYLKNPIDRWLAHRSQRRLDKIEKTGAETKIWAKFLLQDPRLLQISLAKLTSLELERILESGLLAVEAVCIYVFASNPTTPTGWILAILIGIVVVFQSIWLNVLSREIKWLKLRHEAVEHWLQEKALCPTNPHIEAKKNEA